MTRSGDVCFYTYAIHRRQSLGNARNRVVIDELFLTFRSRVRESGLFILLLSFPLEI